MESFNRRLFMLRGCALVGSAFLLNSSRINPLSSSVQLAEVIRYNDEKTWTSLNYESKTFVHDISYRTTLPNGITCHAQLKKWLHDNLRIKDTDHLLAKSIYQNEMAAKFTIQNGYAYWNFKFTNLNSKTAWAKKMSAIKVTFDGRTYPELV